LIRGKIANVRRGLGGFTSFIFSDVAVVAFSAVILTPIVAAWVVPMLYRVPFLQNYPTITLLVAAIIIFFVAGMFKGLLRALVTGVAAGLALNAFQGSSIGQRVLASATQRLRRSG